MDPDYANLVITFTFQPHIGQTMQLWFWLWILNHLVDFLRHANKIVSWANYRHIALLQIMKCSPEFPISMHSLK